MKKIITGIFLVAVILATSSCKKNNTGTVNSWNFKEVTYNTYSCLAVSSTLQATSATNVSNYGTLDIYFPGYNVPTTGGTYTVLNNISGSPTGDQMTVSLTTGGASPVTYYSTGTGYNQATVSVSSTGKVSVTSQSITMQNVNNPADSGYLVLNLTQTQ